MRAKFAKSHKTYCNFTVESNQPLHIEHFTCSSMHQWWSNMVSFALRVKYLAYLHQHFTAQRVSLLEVEVGVIENFY